MQRGTCGTGNDAAVRNGVVEAIEWTPVKTKIYTMVPFTWTRCLFFLGSISLYATDIVRSGLGIRHVTSFGNQQLGIETFASFGPYAYPIQTIRKQVNHHAPNGTPSVSFVGFAETGVGAVGDEITQVKLWPYKFDTLSVGLRGLAMELGVQEYPTCLLTGLQSCPFEFLSLEQVFTMLDGFMDGTTSRLDQDAHDRMVFAVQHQWVDTIEQTLFAHVRDEVYVRFCTLHVYRQNATHGSAPMQLLDLCRRRQHRYDGPSFCTTARWSAALPIAPANPNETHPAEKVQIDEHIALRFARFQAENPELDIDMIVLTASYPQFMDNIASVYYLREGEEVVTLLRGRKCDSTEPRHRNCETMLVDDYRYERSWFETNVQEMYGYIALLRGTAQVYVWLRLVMLVIGITASTWHEAKSEPVGLIKVGLMAWVNLLKVPSHVVVYGTIVPIVLHASAHLADCYLYHLIVQDALTTVMGNDALLNYKTDINYVTLKMRNIWFIGLLCVLIVWYRTHVRYQGSWKHSIGIVGFRGSMISFLSCSTLFFPARLPSLRQIDILSFTWHEVNWTIDGMMPRFRREFSPAPTGPFLEIRCFCLAVTAFMALVLCVQVIARFFSRRSLVVMSHSTVIPYSAGTLWSTMALTGYWVTSIHRRRSAMRPSVVPTPVHSGSPLAAYFKIQRKIVLHKTPDHIRALRVETRTGEMWALIRLMNIVMMTNPWVYLRLRFIGVPLFLYRTSEPPKESSVGQEPRQAFLLPDRVERLYEMNQLEFDAKFELIGVVDSKHVPWHQLIMCG